MWTRSRLGAHLTTLIEHFWKFLILYNFVINHTIGSPFCTCHDSSAVVACAKFWPDLIITFRERAIRFGSWAHRPFVNSVPGLLECNTIDMIIAARYPAICKDTLLPLETHIDFLPLPPWVSLFRWRYALHALRYGMGTLWPRLPQQQQMIITHGQLYRPGCVRFSATC